MHRAGIVGVKAEESVVASAGLERVAANGAIGLDRTGRVLNLVVDTLRELRCRSDRFTQRLELPWVSSALRRGVVRQCGPHLTQGLDGTRFGLRGGIALALRHDEPQETPDRGEENTQQHAPPQQNLLQGRLHRRLIRARDGYSQIRAASRAKLRPLIDFRFAFAGSIHGGQWKAGSGRAEMFARAAVSN